MGFLVFTFAGILIVFLLLEGFASTVDVAWSIKSAKLIGERTHTEYDPEIGWIQIPNLTIGDLYGPGKGMQSNGQRFRNDYEFTTAAPEGCVRFLFSGDSFTMGFGVENADTYPENLERLDPRIETVNMAQSGYGIDQTFLWFKRAAGDLEYDVHIFACITANFLRMQRDTYLGYGRPVLVLENGSLDVRNTPIPKRAYSMPHLPRYLRELQKLKVVWLGRSLLPRRPGLDATAKDEQTREVVAEIFRTLREKHRRDGKLFVLVYLPNQADYMGDKSEPWRDYLRDLAVSEELLLVDLFDEFRKVPAQEVSKLFNKGYGHYSPKGNAFFAAALERELRAIPEYLKLLPATH